VTHTEGKSIAVAPGTAAAERKRRLVYGVAAACLLIPSIVGLSFFLDGPVQQLARPLRNSTTQPVIFVLGRLGDMGSLAVMAVGLYVVGALTRRRGLRRAAVRAGFAIGVTWLLVGIVKVITARGPDGSFDWFLTSEWFQEAELSTMLDTILLFPSGHAATAFAFGMAFARSHRRVFFLSMIAALCISISRIVAGHFLSDVVAGALLGGFVGVLVAELGSDSRAAHGQQ